MFTKKSNDIIVSVEAQFLEEQSCPENNDYVWDYHIRIENTGDLSLQLKSRVWRITDGYGITEEIVGEGVLGDQPVLDAGETFEYSSAVSLNTPTGIMAGEYKMVSAAGNLVDVDIPAFSLDSPFGISTLH